MGEFLGNSLVSTRLAASQSVPDRALVIQKGVRVCAFGHIQKVDMPQNIAEN